MPLNNKSEFPDVEAGASALLARFFPSRAPRDEETRVVNVLERGSMYAKEECFIGETRFEFRFKIEAFASEEWGRVRNENIAVLECEEGRGRWKSALFDVVRCIGSGSFSQYAQG